MTGRATGRATGGATGAEAGKGGWMQRSPGPNVFPYTCPGKETSFVRAAPGRGVREEKRVPKRTDGTSRSPGQESAESPPLPDLTGFDLRTLRTSEDPAVTAAVESTLSRPERLTRVWRSTGSEGHHRPMGGRGIEPGPLGGQSASGQLSRPGPGTSPAATAFDDAL